MKKPLETLRSHLIIGFEQIHGREPNETELEELDEDMKNPDSIHLVAAFESYARQEKQKLAQELLNAFTKLRKTNGGDLADYLNFNALRHLYPNVSFEDAGGGSVTVNIKE